MARVNNYLIQAGQAKERFLTYDQDQLIAKFRLEADEHYLYPHLLDRRYRLSRTTASLEYWQDGCWRDGNSYEEVMTLLDLLCDSREDRWISGQWQNMQSFGMQFHQNLLEDRRDPLTEAIDAAPEKFRQACLALGAEVIPGGDMGYGLELFDGLKMGMLFWHGDDEFAPRLRWLWDRNANMYLRYETMYFAVGMLKQRIAEYLKFDNP